VTFWRKSAIFPDLGLEEGCVKVENPEIRRRIVRLPEGYKGSVRSTQDKEHPAMVVLGLILLIIGLVAGISILTTIGIILLIVGLILNFVPIGGNRRRVF